MPCCLLNPVPSSKDPSKASKTGDKLLSIYPKGIMSHTNDPGSNLSNSLIFTTLTLNSTTLYSLENTLITSAHSIDINELISNQLISEINSSKSNVGSIPIQLAALDLTLYYIKYILPSNDIVTVITLFQVDIPLYFPIGVLENILTDFKEYRETNDSNIEFKVKFNQIIKFHELNYKQNNTGELQKVKNIMNDNIEMVMERNERIGLLVNKTDRINELSNGFRNNSVKIKRKMWWSNVKFWVILTAVGLLLLLILFKVLFG